MHQRPRKAAHEGMRVGARTLARGVALAATWSVLAVLVSWPELHLPFVLISSSPEIPRLPRKHRFVRVKLTKLPPGGESVEVRPRADTEEDAAHRHEFVIRVDSLRALLSSLAR
jgi:hypothetical protein